ncbi:b149.4 [miniopterid betaherpesvirus 1]|uniref:B149.4 n=1 Tax=miniopterid betaherpesvirus 1 TaxID=3070189 RepID=I3VQD8_9BETA|nr:b149.4 [miniopterid betaherpesvirus 1]AFK83982.1 b149.4 [miniopterid betaherpesvirus 1]
MLSIIKTFYHFYRIMFSRTEICIFGLLLCAMRISCNNKCKIYLYQLAINKTSDVRCGGGNSMHVYSCYTNITFNIQAGGYLNDILFEKTSNTIIAKGVGFKYTHVGWYECLNRDSCVSKAYYIVRSPFTYTRHAGYDTVMCDTIFPEVAASWMKIDGINVTDQCRKHKNGSISYTAPRITTARCMSYLWCMGISFYTYDFHLHQKINVTRNGTRLECVANEGKAFLQTIHDETGGRFSDRQDPNRDNESTAACGWCVRAKGYDAYVSDAFNLNDTHKNCYITETDAESSHAFVGNAANFDTILSYSVLLVNVFLTLELCSVIFVPGNF